MKTNLCDRLWWKDIESTVTIFSFSFLFSSRISDYDSPLTVPCQQSVTHFAAFKSPREPWPSLLLPLLLFYISSASFFSNTNRWRAYRDHWYLILYIRFLPVPVPVPVPRAQSLLFLLNAISFRPSHLEIWLLIQYVWYTFESDFCNACPSSSGDCRPGFITPPRNPPIFFFFFFFFYSSVAAWSWHSLHTHVQLPVAE